MEHGAHDGELDEKRRITAMHRIGLRAQKEGKDGFRVCGYLENVIHSILHF